jgi:MoCo/4Fe-4S cofactor protein with predicted Tat translocation signal
MKRIVQHPQPAGPSSVAWRGTDSLAGSPEARRWLEREFQEGASEIGGDGEVSRREFVRLMGAATALAGLSGASCRRPVSHLVPFVKGVEWVVPGKALLYTTVMPWRDEAVPLVVTTYEGRPTKLDGNPLHPNSSGTTDAITQASVLDLYDPDRSQKPLGKGRPVPAADLAAALGKFRAELAATQGKGFGFLLGLSSSPTRRMVVDELRRIYPEARWFRYESLEAGGQRAALDRVFGRGARLATDFRKATRVLALDCDFLGGDKESTASVADFAAARRPEGDDLKPRPEMVRLYVAEPAMSLAGGMADHRLRLGAGKVVRLAALLAAEVAAATGDAALKALAEAAGATPDPARIDPRWVKECAADLAAAAGKSVVLAGPRQPEATHLLVAAINRALGSFAPDGCVAVLQGPADELGSLADLKAAVDSGAVERLVSLTAADPAYDTPGDFGWPALRERLKQLIHVGPRVNRTAVEADIHVPGTHFLEEWGDACDHRGTYSVVQPMILPLYGGTSELRFLADLLPVAPGEAAPDAAADPVHAQVKVTFRRMLRAAMDEREPDAAWDASLRDGYLEGSAYPALAPGDFPAEAAAVVKAAVAAVPAGDALEVNFSADGCIYDGRFINNGWLQEAPDPITKLTWDNAALISPRTAEKLGVFTPKGGTWLAEKLGQPRTDSRFQSLGDGDQTVPMVRITVAGRSVELPVLVAFGHCDDAITLPLGWGQSGDRPGMPRLPMRVGHGTGFDVNPLRSVASPFIATATVGQGEGRHTLALTQEHGAMEGRALVREGTVERYRDNPGFAAKEAEDSHIPEGLSLYKPMGTDPRTGEPRRHLFDEKNQWAMVIDLNQCTGCNACLVACQAENNIPIVGKDQVRRGREMHWIRMDRYFVARQDKHGHYLNEDNPEMLVQPVACVHCEAAPCETVCPVNATVHSEDGLNLMAYNRCIGTRYCANNCPYKARRFNFFDYNKRPLDELYKGPLSSTSGVPQSMRLQKNPNVSVRMRGVMEKCTYCIQRLEGAKIKQFELRRRKPQETGKPSHEVELSVAEIRVPGDAVKVACQQACPSEAIVFGNLLDPQSRIRRFKRIDESIERRPIVSEHPRNYDLLKYVNALPRTSYLARIKNPNPRMPDGALVGNATISIH